MITKIKYNQCKICEAGKRTCCKEPSPALGMCHTCSLPQVNARNDFQKFSTYCIFLVDKRSQSWSYQWEHRELPRLPVFTVLCSLWCVLNSCKSNATRGLTYPNLFTIVFLLLLKLCVVKNLVSETEFPGHLCLDFRWQKRHSYCFQ